MEQKNVKIFYKPIDGGELKELKGVTKIEGFEPLEEPIDVKCDQTPVTKGWSFSLDMVLDNKQSKEIRKLFYCRIPRKKKKRFKKGVARYHDCKIRDIKVSKYWGDYIAKQYDCVNGTNVLGSRNFQGMKMR